MMGTAHRVALAGLLATNYVALGTSTTEPDYSTMPDYEFSFEEHFDGATNCFGLAHNASGVGGTGSAGQFPNMAIGTYSCTLPSLPETDSYGIWEISFWIRGDVPKAGTSSANQVMRTDIYFEDGNTFLSSTMSLPQGDWVAHLGNNRAPGGTVVGLGEWQWLSITIDASNYFYGTKVPARLVGRTMDPAAPANYVNDNWSLGSSWGGKIGPRLHKLDFVNFRAIVSIDAVRIRAKNRYHLARPVVFESFDNVAAPGPQGLSCNLLSAPHTSIITDGTGNKALQMDSYAANDVTYTNCDVMYQPQDGILSSWVLDLDIVWKDVLPDHSQLAGTEHPRPGLELLVMFGGVDGFPETQLVSRILWDPEVGRLFGVWNDDPTTDRRFAADNPNASPVLKGESTHFEFDYSPAQWGQSEIEHVGVFATNAAGQPLFRVSEYNFVMARANPFNANAGTEFVPPITKVSFRTLHGSTLVLDNVRVRQRGLEIRPGTSPSASQASTAAAAAATSAAAPASTSTASPTTAAATAAPTAAARPIGLHIKQPQATIQIGSGAQAVGLFNNYNGAIATEDKLVVQGHDLLAILLSIQTDVQALSQRVYDLEHV